MCKRLLGIVLVFLGVFPPIATAQSAVRGIVKDGNGRVVIGARVTVRDATGREWRTSTSSIGSYEIAPLPPGQYSVSVEAEFYDRYEGQVVLIRHVMAHLDVGLVLRRFETVTVSGRLPMTEAPLASAGLGVGTIFTRAAIESMPFANGRTIQSMLALVPGITLTESVGTLAQFTVGQRRFANRMLVDGISVDLALDLRGRGIGEGASGGLPGTATSGGTQTLIPLDAIDEVQVRTSTTTAEHARSSGAQTSIISRAGGDEVSGATFVTIRPNGLSASDWFANAGLAPERENSLSDVGASIGGPASSRLRYFAAWERQALNRSISTTVEVPSQAARDVAPAPLRQILDAFPIPNGPELGDGLAAYANRVPVVSNLWVLNGRVDTTAAGRHRVFGRVNVGESSGDALTAAPYQVPFVPYASRESASTRTGTAGWNMFGEKTNNELRINVTRQMGHLENGAARHGGARPISLSDLLPKSRHGETAAFFAVFAGPSGTVSTGQLRRNEHWQFQTTNTLTAVRGRHEFKFGLDYSRIASITTSAAHLNTFRFGSVGRLLDGMPVPTAQLNLLPAAVLRHAGAVYGQDTWRVSSKLTVDYGVRYSVAPAPSSANEFDPLLLDIDALPARRVLPNGTRLWRTRWDNVAPRVAAAYRFDKIRDKATVLRAGLGIAFDGLTSPGAGAFGRGYPYITGRPALVSLPSSATSDPSVPAGPFPPNDPAEYFAFPREFAAPRTTQWHAGIDQPLTRTQRVSAAYAGTNGRNLVYWYAYPAGTTRAAINVYVPLASSSYHAFLLEYTKQLASNWRAKTVYTWSRSVDTDSGESLSAEPPPQLVAVDTNKGPSDFDRTQRLAVSATYQIRLASTSRKLLRLLADGWDVSVAVTAMSGAPVTPTTRRVLDGGSYRLRMDRVPGVPLWNDDGMRRMNPSAFVVPAESRQGHSGRNILRATPLHQADLSIARTVRWGALTGSIRFDVFNAFNLVNFAPPLMDFGIEGFGVPYQSYADGLGTGTLVGGGLAPLQQMGGPRTLQVGLRVGF